MFNLDHTVVLQQQGRDLPGVQVLRLWGQQEQLRDWGELHDLLPHTQVSYASTTTKIQYSTCAILESPTFPRLGGGGVKRDDLRKFWILRVLMSSFPSVRGASSKAISLTCWRKENKFEKSYPCFWRYSKLMTVATLNELKKIKISFCPIFPDSVTVLHSEPCLA